MSELNIDDLDIVADTSLDGTGIEGKWLDDEFHVFFTRGGKVIAGFTLGERALRALHVLIGAALALSNAGEKQ